MKKELCYKKISLFLLRRGYINLQFLLAEVAVDQCPAPSVACCFSVVSSCLRWHFWPLPVSPNGYFFIGRLKVWILLLQSNVVQHGGCNNQGHQFVYVTSVQVQQTRKTLLPSTEHSLDLGTICLLGSIVPLSRSCVHVI